MQLSASTSEVPASAVRSTSAKEVSSVINPVENPYGLEAVWRSSDLVARFVLALLVMMSAGTWYILVTKLLEQRKISRQARSVDETFWQAKTVSDGAKNLAKKSVYRYIAEAGARSIEGHAGLKRHIPLDDWVSMSIVAAVDRVNANTQKGLSFLATVGSTSPFIGLFGTVWGIYHALTAIGLSGQASIDKVAGPVGEALIMTAIGLAVAIPAVLAYNWLARRNRALIDEIREFGEELTAVVIGSIQAR
jgi:biopolymer transport protein ExbB